MRFLKLALQNGLAWFGWRLSRLEPNALAADGSRIVWRVFYRDHCFQCFKGDVITEKILAGKGFEDQLADILKCCTDPNRPDVIEVGANIGTTFITVAQDYPALRFHCVEPVPEFYDLLKKNAATYAASNARLYPLALAAQADSEIKIHTLLGTAGATRRFDGYIDAVLTMRSQSLDSVFAAARPSLVKIDVDGFELEVLKGGKKLLSTWRPLLYLEYDLAIMKRVGSSAEELHTLLQELGYRKIQVWDTDDKNLGELTSFEELKRLAQSLPFYANVLFAP